MAVYRSFLLRTFTGAEGDYLAYVMFLARAIRV